MERKSVSDKATGTSADSAKSPVGSRCESRTAMPGATSHAFGRLRQQTTGDDAIQSLPLEGKVAAPEALTDEVASDEADVSPKEADIPKGVARLETLRRIMLILAPILLLSGYAMDVLPILYASAVPLTVALIATYRIKHLEESVEK